MRHVGAYRVWAGIIGAGCLVSVWGCGGGTPPPKTYPVTGSVVYNNAPVVGATVTFMSDAAPRQAVGVTDKDGKFQLSTFAINDGAVAGEHKITVAKEEALPAGEQLAPTTGPGGAGVNPTQMIANYQKASEARKTEAKPLVPTKYASIQTTTLKETVKAEGTNQFVLTLSD
jgi:hypothetical protein